MKLTSNSHATLAMRLRQVTAIPLAECFEFLAGMEASERQRYVEHFEAVQPDFLIDPVELSPLHAERIASVREEALALYKAGHFGTGRGSGGGIDYWQQQELLKRHGIVWRTRQQMNPKVAFD